MNMYRCRICGETYLGSEPPSHCPFCGAHRELLVDTTDYPENINDVRPTEVEKEDLLTAIYLELNNTHFYLGMGAHKADNPKLASAYKRLAKVEAEHCELFCKLAGLPVPADLTVEERLDHLVEAALRTFGRIDILVNNHGTTFRAPAHEYPTAEWDRVMEVNLRSVFLLTTRVAREMIAAGRGGKIINIASLLSEIGVPLVPPYAASKGAIRSLTKAWAVEWAQYRINVNAIGPGYFRTEMTEPLFHDPERSRIVMERVAIKRWGDPKDLKGAVVFLASPASDYVTGQVLYVDGGWLAK